MDLHQPSESFKSWTQFFESGELKQGHMENMQGFGLEDQGWETVFEGAWRFDSGVMEKDYMVRWVQIYRVPER